MLRRLALLALLLLPSLAMAQRQRAQLWCEEGGQRAIVNGIESRTFEQGSFPSCQVDVFTAGSLTPVVLCSDAACTSPGDKTNPFTATSTGYITFFVETEPALVDIRLSGSTLPAAFTLPDVQLCGSGCSGGGPTGDAVIKHPTTTQTVLQPKGTTLEVSSLGQVRYATDYQWSQTPTSPATIAIGANTVTINAVLGVSAYSVTKVKHYLWLAGTGTPERVLLTAPTTCTGVSTGTCTVTFTAVGTHSAGYTLGTSTAGWQEAWVDAFPVNISNPMMASKLSGSPTNNNASTARYRFNAPLDIDMQRGTQTPIVIDGQGSVIECNTSGLACLDYGTGTAGTLGLQPLDTVIENFLFVPAAGLGRTANGTTMVIHDHGQALTLRNLSFGSLGTADYFDYIAVIDDDENFTWDGNHVNPGNGVPMLCDTTWCGTVLKGNSFSVGNVTNSDFQMQCRGNAIDWANNILGVSGSLFQAWSQFAMRFDAPFPNFGLTLNNVYFEAACTNPLGTGNAGLIIIDGFVNIQGGSGLSAVVPSFVASAPGANQFNYWVVAKSSTLGTSTPLLAGSCLSNGTGTCTVKFNQIGTSGTMTWDLIRLVGNLGGADTAPYTAITTGGAPATPGSVATGITAASCTTTGAGSVCTVVDDVSLATAAYTVVGPATFFPKPTLWPGNLVLGPGTDTNSLAIGASARLYADRLPNGIVSMSGRNAISAAATICGSVAVGAVGYIKCNTVDAVAGGITAAEVKSLGQAAIVSRKGLTLYSLDPGTTSPSTDIITLADSNPAKTSATPGNRPTSDANDCAIGYDQVNSNTSLFRMGLRCPLGLRISAGSIFDNSSWKYDFSPTLFSTLNPIRNVASAAPAGSAGSGWLWFDSTLLRTAMKNGANTTLEVGNFKITSTCGTTTTCSGTAVTNPQVVLGHVTLAGGTATITGMPAFTSTSSFECTANDRTAVAAVQVAIVSATSITLTGTGTDVVGYSCIGN